MQMVMKALLKELEAQMATHSVLSRRVLVAVDARVSPHAFLETKKEPCKQEFHQLTMLYFC